MKKIVMILRKNIIEEIKKHKKMCNITLEDYNIIINKLEMLKIID